MTEQEDEDIDPLGNVTRRPARASQRTVGPPTKFPPYFVPRRPQVVKMRDLSPASKTRLANEYYDDYDPWTGIRIAATLGILISLFTLFLLYKSRFNKSKTTLLPPKKASLYLYEEEDSGALGNVGSSDDSSSYAYSYAYGGSGENIPHGYHFGVPGEDFPLEEVLVQSTVMECVNLTVHSKKDAKGPQFGTLRITEDVSRSLPCSPYKQPASNVPNDAATDRFKETGFSEQVPSKHSSFSGSITSFGSTDSSVHKSAFVKGKSKGPPIVIAGPGCLKKPRNIAPTDEITVDDNNGSSAQTSTLVISAKRPQDYRSRSTVVAIARRKRKA